MEDCVVFLTQKVFISVNLSNVSFTQEMRTPQVNSSGNSSTNVGLTQIGLVQTSDSDKLRTETNFRLRQTSNQYKRRISTNVETSTNVGRVHYKEKRRTLIEFEKIPLL